MNGKTVGWGILAVLAGFGAGVLVGHFALSRSFLRISPVAAVQGEIQSAASLRRPVQSAIYQAAARKIAKDWLKADPTAARAWVAQSKLPDELKQNFANNTEAP